MGLLVVRAVDGEGEVTIDTAPSQLNVIAAMHSSGLITLADAAGLAALISVMDSVEQVDAIVPLGRSATMEFRAPARGRLVATCRLAGTDLDAALTLRSAGQTTVRLSTVADIRDVSGCVVCTGRFDWSIRRVELLGATPIA